MKRIYAWRCPECGHVFAMDTENPSATESGGVPRILCPCREPGVLCEFQGIFRQTGTFVPAREGPFELPGLLREMAQSIEEGAAPSYYFCAFNASEGEYLSGFNVDEGDDIFGLLGHCVNMASRIERNIEQLAGDPENLPEPSEEVRAPYLELISPKKGDPDVN